MNDRYKTVMLKANRLVLDKGNLNDFIKVYEYDYNELSAYGKLVKRPPDDFKKMFKKGKDAYYEKCMKAHAFDWIIFYQKVPVGNIFTEALNDKETEVTFNLHPSYWGNGYAKEALEAVLDELFKTSFENVYCKYLDENIKAKRMLESFGFKPYFIDKDSHQKQDGKTCDEYEVILNKETWLSRTLRINIKDSL